MRAKIAAKPLFRLCNMRVKIAPKAIKALSCIVSPLSIKVVHGPPKTFCWARYYIHGILISFHGKFQNYSHSSIVPAVVHETTAKRFRRAPKYFREVLISLRSTSIRSAEISYVHVHPLSFKLVFRMSKVVFWSSLVVTRNSVSVLLLFCGAYMCLRGVVNCHYGSFRWLYWVSK